ncbi:hypothetical protein [Streptomyces sp. NPDC002845]
MGAVTAEDPAHVQHTAPGLRIPQGPARDAQGTQQPLVGDDSARFEQRHGRRRTGGDGEALVGEQFAFGYGPDGPRTPRAPVGSVP